MAARLWCMTGAVVLAALSAAVGIATIDADSRMVPEPQRTALSSEASAPERPDLQSASTGHLIALAVPGVAGLAGFTALGVLIGYRNASRPHGIAPHAARYLP
ncbi:MAG: hypothetical protein HYZ39_21910 [Mycolicibacterium cosmeticum]|nr:hypothetical protein [Mycolicibacterium cosmeticum]